MTDAVSCLIYRWCHRFCVESRRHIVQRRGWETGRNQFSDQGLMCVDGRTSLPKCFRRRIAAGLSAYLIERFLAHWLRVPFTKTYVMESQNQPEYWSPSDNVTFERLHAIICFKVTVDTKRARSSTDCPNGLLLRWNNPVSPSLHWYGSIALFETEKRM
jgi:hypothetical protein